MRACLAGFSFAMTIAVSVAYSKSHCELEAMRNFLDHELSAFKVVTIRQAEGFEPAYVRHRDEKPIDRKNPRWVKLKSQIRIGDCLIYYSSHNNYWGGLTGSSAYLLFRSPRASKRKPGKS